MSGLDFFQGGNCPGENCLRGIYSYGDIVRGGSVRGNYPRGNLSVTISIDRAMSVSSGLG